MLLLRLFVQLLFPLSREEEEEQRRLPQGDLPSGREAGLRQRLRKGRPKARFVAS